MTQERKQDDLVQLVQRLTDEVAELRNQYSRGSTDVVVREAANKRRLYVIASRCSIATLLLSIIFTYGAVTFLREPSTSENSGLIRLSVASKPQNPVGIVVVRSADELDISLLIPQELFGSKYSVEIDGVSRIDQSFPRPRATKIQKVIKDGFQLDGQVPLSNRLTGPPSAGGDIYEPQCNLTAQSSAKYVSLEIFASAADGDTDWPFTSLSAPSIETLTAEGAGLDNFSCQSIRLPSGVSVADSSPTPDYQSDSQLDWSDSAAPASILLRPSFAVPLGNLCIILAGIAFAVTAGFAPMLVENRTRTVHRRRRFRRWKNLIGRK